MEITVNYLKTLKKPEYAISNELWNIYRLNIFDCAKKNNDFEQIIDLKFHQIANAIGILWDTKSSGSVSNLLHNYPNYDDFINLKNMGKWYKRAVVFVISNLAEIDEYKMNLLLPLLSIDDADMFNNGEEYLLDVCRRRINSAFISTKCNITNENFEELLKKLVKELLKSLLDACKFKTEDYVPYILVFLERVINKTTYIDIKDKYGYQPSVSTLIMRKFKDTFDELYKDEDDRNLICRRLQTLFNTAYDVLDKTDLVKRNERIFAIKRIQNRFLGANMFNMINIHKAKRQPRTIKPKIES